MFEMIEIFQSEVACDGGGGPLGHPRVYLHVDHDADDSITCPYCSRSYVLRHPHIPAPVGHVA